MREYWVRLLRWLAQLKEGFALSLTQASNAPPLPSVQRAAAGAHPPVRPPPPSLPPSPFGSSAAEVRSREYSRTGATPV
jgi:hypothetical protein